MVLLANVIQSGAGVTSRYEMERVVSGAVAATGFEDIATLEQYNGTQIKTLSGRGYWSPRC